MFRKVKKRLIMLMLAMCLAMSPAYSFMMVQDPLAIVTTINNFVQTVTYYKNQIQKTYDEYKRIEKSIKSINPSDWKTWVQAATDLSNQINGWDIAGTQTDLVLQLIETGGTGTLDIAAGVDNVINAWKRVGTTFEKLGNADYSGNLWDNLDTGLDSFMTGMNAVDRAITISGKELNNAIYSVTDTYNVVAEFTQAEYDKLQETIDNLYEQQSKQEKILEEQKEKQKKLLENYSTILTEISNAASGQQDTVVQQKTVQKEKIAKELSDMEKKIEKTQSRIDKIKETIEKKQATLTAGENKARTNAINWAWLKSTQEFFDKARLSGILDGWRDSVYVSTYGRN